MLAVAQSVAQSDRPAATRTQRRAYNCNMGACQFRSGDACRFRNHLVEDHKISVYTVAVMDL